MNPNPTQFVPTTVRALAKLTLSLRIGQTRPDGYHEIDAEMVTLDLCDELTFKPGEGLEVFGAVGLPVQSDDDNLVRRALKATGRTAQVRLDKRIPAGAGLGGGSADAAAVLRWAGCDDIEIAASLGADVPFCLIGGHARVSGLGEIIEPLPATNKTFTLLTPPFGVSTVAVYRKWDELGGPRSVGPNDLEIAAIAVEPRLTEWRERLKELTGLEPVLAGSGSTWFVEGGFVGEGLVVTRTDRP